MSANLDTTEKYGYECTLYTVITLIDEGFLLGEDWNTGNATITRIPFKGHCLLDLIKEKGVWKQIKRKIKILPIISIKVMYDIGIEIAKKNISIE